MKIKIGQSVKVKEGILCPDDPEFDLSGWQGRIFDPGGVENGEVTIGITWDSVTLKEMSDRYIEKSELEGLDWAVMYLSLSDIEPANARDSAKDTDKIRDTLEHRFGWLEMGEEGKRIQAVVNSIKSDDDWELMKGWKKHLQMNLEFPFESIVDEHQDRGPFRQGDKLIVSGIETVDDLYGVIASCRTGKKKCKFPLVDLAAVDENSDNAQIIQDYRVWFSNR